MSELGDDRKKFTRLISTLILWIIDQGYEVMIGQDGQKHMASSLHYIGLAKDLLIFKNGTYLTKTEDYLFAGEQWESMDPECRWGGRFKKPDGNHFSNTSGGRA